MEFADNVWSAFELVKSGYEVYESENGSRRKPIYQLKPTGQSRINDYFPTTRRGNNSGGQCDRGQYRRTGHTGEYSGGSTSGSECETDGKAQGNRYAEKQADCEESEADPGESTNDLFESLLACGDIDSDGEIGERNEEIELESEESASIQDGKRTRYDNEGIRAMARKARETFERSFMAGIRELGFKRRIVHDIFELPTNGLEQGLRGIILPDVGPGAGSFRRDENGLRERGRTKLPKRGIFIIASHGSHVHVIHDCTYSNGTCRCQFMRNFADIRTDDPEDSDYESWSQAESQFREQRTEYQRAEKGLESDDETGTGGERRGSGTTKRGRSGASDPDETPEKKRRGDSGHGLGRGRQRRIRRYARRVSPSSVFNIWHWFLLSSYFMREERQLNYYEVAGRAWVLHNKIRHNALQGLYEQVKQDGMVENSFVPIHSTGLFEGIRCLQTRSSPPEGDHSTNASHQKVGSGFKTHKLEQWLQTFIITPPQNILYTGFWINSRFRYYNKSSSLVKNCFHNIQQQLVDMSVKDLFLKTRSININRLIYVGPWNNIRTYYYNITDSVRVLDSLLEFQYGGRQERYRFLLDLYNLLDRNVPKKNCMLVVGPPNSGKNYFFNCVIHSCINFGQMGNFNKFTNFPMMECIQRRVILWDEPNFEPGAEEILKTIFAGDTTNVKVKYQGDAVLLRTPIVVLSNSDIFPKNEAFNTRMYREQWRRASWLKNLKKRPHPLAWFYLLLKYKLINFKYCILEDWEKELINNQ